MSAQPRKKFGRIAPVENWYSFLVVDEHKFGFVFRNGSPRGLSFFGRAGRGERDREDELMVVSKSETTATPTTSRENRPINQRQRTSSCCVIVHVPSRRRFRAHRRTAQSARSPRLDLFAKAKRFSTPIIGTTARHPTRSPLQQLQTKNKPPLFRMNITMSHVTTNSQVAPEQHPHHAGNPQGAHTILRRIPGKSPSTSNIFKAVMECMSEPVKQQLLKDPPLRIALVIDDICLNDHVVSSIRSSVSTCCVDSLTVTILVSGS